MSDQARLKEEFEESLKQLVLTRIPENLPGLREMVSFHFGWQDPSAKTGKRLRPMLMLTSSGMFASNPLGLMPAAVAMEVLHNYTLIHDDIEDQGETRHGRECLWRRYGLAQALNVGDFLSTMAHDIFCEVAKAVDPATFERAYLVFREATLGVLRGQYLDIHFETEENVSVDQYHEMISLKTACLISASIQIGGILGGADEKTVRILREIGEHAGLAFQIQDDYLGIWGDTASTGKSNLTDLTTRKKTYPILLGMAESPAFRAIWDESLQVNQSTARQLALLLAESRVDERTTEAVFAHVHAIKVGLDQLESANGVNSGEMWSLLNSAFTPAFSSSLKPHTPA